MFYIESSAPSSDSSAYKGGGLLCDGLDPNRTSYFTGNLGTSSDLADCLGRCVSDGTCKVVRFISSNGLCYGYSQYSGTCGADGSVKTYDAGYVAENTSVWIDAG